MQLMVAGSINSSKNEQKKRDLPDLLEKVLTIYLIHCIVL